MSEEIKCGIFMDQTFGGLLKSARIKNQITLRKMCSMLNVDAGNYSKLERSILHPPKSRQDVDKILAPLEISNQEKSRIYQAAFNHHLALLIKRFE